MASSRSLATPPAHPGRPQTPAPTGESGATPPLVVENLHWIDAETQAFLDGLVESPLASRLLLLVSYRPEYQHGWDTKT